MERLVCGTEIEFGVVRKGEDQSYDKQFPLVLCNFNRSIRRFGIPNNDDHRTYSPVTGDTWLWNGGRFRSDQNRPELDTPECRSLDEVVRYERALKGILQSLSLLEEAQRRAGNLPPRNLALFANNASYPRMGECTTFGYHENYKVDAPILRLDLLTLFLITRQVFAGAGCAIPTKYQPYFKTTFTLSQRGLFVLSSSENPGKAKVGDRRDIFSIEDSLVEKGNRILHVAIGDTNESSVATKLKIGTTALVMEMLEMMKDKEDIAYNKYSTEYDAHAVTRDISCGKHLITCMIDDRLQRLRATEVQRMFLLLVEKYIGFGRDAETDWVLAKWRETLDQLEKDPMGANWLDWVAKKRAIDVRLSRGGTWEECVRIDLGWHALDHSHNIAKLIWPEAYTSRAVGDAMLKPPSNTRAVGRSIVLAGLRDRGVPDEKLPVMAWGYMHNGRKGKLSMPDPTETYEDEAENFLKSF